MQTTFDFLNPSEYTTVGATISSGGKLASLLDANLELYASYLISIDAEFPNTITGTGTNSPVISSGHLDLTGGNRYITYSPTLPAQLALKGCIRLKYTPTYTGSPVALQNIVSMGASNSNNNRLDINHKTNGQLALQVYNAAGNVLTINVEQGLWAPTAGQEYEIEFDYDFTAGASYFFIDGVAFGSTIATTSPTRNSVSIIRIGESVVPAAQTNFFKVRQFTVYQISQHTAGYAAPTAALIKYTTGTIRTLGGFTAKQITLLETTVTLNGGTILYGFTEGGLRYWDGSTWALSDGSAGQLNTLADFNAHIASALSINETENLFVRLTSGDGIQTPVISEAVFTYIFGGIEPTAPAVCTVWGYIKDASNVIIPNATVTFKPYITNPALYLEAASHLISGKSISATTDANGYFEVDLIQSAQFENPGFKYIVTILTNSSQNILSDGSQLVITIPSSSNANLTSLLTAI